MGAPVFKYRQLFKEQGVVQFSANFELYGDISERITRLLSGITPRIEVYSVDESFLDLSTLGIDEYEGWAQLIRRRLQREVGVPVSVGIATSKTLAKLASERAKKDLELDNVLDLMTISPARREQYLLRTPISDVWGVGRRLTPRLRAEGVYTAFDLSQMRPRHAGQLMGVHGRQMIAELNGECCHRLELLGKIRQSVMHGRMFGEDTDKFSVIEAAIASLTARATFRLRRENLLARRAVLSLSTNRHKPGFVHQRQEVQFATPTADTGAVTAALVEILQELFRSGHRYHRANVLLYDLVGTEALQIDLLGQVDVGASERSHARLKALDQLNRRYGKRTVRYAAEDLSEAWEPKHQLRSPRYTTNWQELPTAHLK
jgi:DNA polymerase V